MEDIQTKKNPIVKVYLGKWITVAYVEEGIFKSAQGIIQDFDDINFVLVKGDFAEKLISTANITSIKLKTKGKNYE